MSELANIIKQRINQNGPISVADFMAEALGNLKSGYYMTCDPLGRSGDFITAPEISQMFGEMIGLWCAVTWQTMGEPSYINLVELGPGRGSLINDALRAARTVPPFLDALRPHLIEISPVLREKQQKILNQLELKHVPQWHDNIDNLPDGPMILLANEFFDSLPIQQFEYTKEGWKKRLVDNNPHGGFCFTLSSQVVKTCFGIAPEGTVREVSPSCINLAGKIGQRLSEQGGAALIIDYGYAKTSFGETLQAVKNHHFADILAEPGNVDLTAHVDFEAIAQAAALHGISVYGPQPQGYFLTHLGIEQRAMMLVKNADEGQKKEILSAYRRLVHPDEMGQLFKVLVFCHADLSPLPGFKSNAC